MGLIRAGVHNQPPIFNNIAYDHAGELEQYNNTTQSNISLNNIIKLITYCKNYNLIQYIIALNNFKVKKNPKNIFFKIINNPTTDKQINKYTKIQRTNDD